MKKSFTIQVSLFAIPFLLSFVATAQNHNLDWVQTYGGNSISRNASMATDHFGNIYYVGSFSGTVDIEPGLGETLFTSDDTDGYLCKMDGQGNFVWAKQISAPGETEFFEVTLDDADNIYLSGKFHDSLDCDLGIDTSYVYSYGGWNGVVIKLNQDGEFIWGLPFGGLYSEYGLDLKVNANQEVFMCGRMQGAANFGNIYLYTTSNNANIFVAKISQSGVFVWAKQMGSPGPNLDQANAMAIDKAGNIYTTGQFSGTADFAPSGSYSLSSAGSTDAFVNKLSSSGNFIWAKQFGGINSDAGVAIGVDSLCNVYFCGEYRNTVDFDPGANTFSLTSAGQADVFIVKLDSAGALLWAKSEGSSYSDLPRAMSVTNSGDIFLTGIFAGTADLNPDPVVVSNISSLGYSDIFIQRLDSAGNLVWVNRIGGSSSEETTDITLDADTNIFASGFFVGTTDFDPSSGFFQVTANNQVEGDAFVLKLTNELVTGMPDAAIATTLTIFPNPSSGVFTIEYYAGDTDATVEIYNAQGQLVLREQLNGARKYQIDGSHFAKGQYHVRIGGNNAYQYAKLMVL